MQPHVPVSSHDLAGVGYHDLRLLNCCVKSLSSKLERLREAKVPGTSSETTLDNFFTEAPNLPKAINVGIEITATEKNAPNASERKDPIQGSDETLGLSKSEWVVLMRPATAKKVDLSVARWLSF